MPIEFSFSALADGTIPTLTPLADTTVDAEAQTGEALEDVVDEDCGTLPPTDAPAMIDASGHVIPPTTTPPKPTYQKMGKMIYTPPPAPVAPASTTATPSTDG